MAAGSAVAIIGGGDLGGAIAAALASRDRVGRVLLVDAVANVAAGKALDIRQSGAIDGGHTALEGTDDLSRVAGCAVCILADRVGPGSPEWAGEDGLTLVSRLRTFLSDMPVVFAGASQGPLLHASALEARLAPPRLIGSATEAWAAAARAIVAMEARCSPREVMLTVLGTPPAGLVIPWSDASIGGYALERALDQVQLNRIDARLQRLWPPGPYTLGLAAARVAEATMDASRATFSVLTLLGGEFGVRNRVGAVPALLSRTGIVHTRSPVLNTRERVRLETALSGP